MKSKNVGLIIVIVILAILIGVTIGGIYIDYDSPFLLRCGCVDLFKTGNIPKGTAVVKKLVFRDGIEFNSSDYSIGTGMMFYKGIDY